MVLFPSLRSFLLNRSRSHVLFLDALVDVEAAVDREDGAGDEAGAAWVDEVEESADEVFDSAEAAHRGAVDDVLCAWLRGAVIVILEGVVLCGMEEARCDGVHTDTALCEVDRAPLGEAGDAGLSGGVSRDAGQRMIGRHRGDVHDVCILLPLQGLAEDLGRQHGAVDVEVELTMHMLEVDGEEGILSLSGFAEVILRNLCRLHSTAGTVHEDIDVPVVREDFFTCSEQAFSVEYIRRHRHSLSAIHRDFIYDLLSVLLTSAEHSHLRTARRQCAGLHAADHTGATGHHGHLSTEINLKWYVHRFFLLLFPMPR